MSNIEFFSLASGLPDSHSVRVKSLASVTGGSLCVEQKAFAPHILMGIDPINPSSEQLNHNFRHELYHLIEPGRTPLYNRRIFRVPAAIPTLVAANFCELAAQPLSNIADELEFLVQSPEYIYPTQLQPLSENYTVGSVAILAAVGALTAYETFLKGWLDKKWYDFLHNLDSGEKQANRFAWEHTDFNPITLTPHA